MFYAQSTITVERERERRERIWFSDGTDRVLQTQIAASKFKISGGGGGGGVRREIQKKKRKTKKAAATSVRRVFICFSERLEGIRTTVYVRLECLARVSLSVILPSTRNGANVVIKDSLAVSSLPSSCLSRAELRLVQVQCCFASTFTIRTVRDGDPGTATSTFTQLLSSELRADQGYNYILRSLSVSLTLCLCPPLGEVMFWMRSQVFHITYRSFLFLFFSPIDLIYDDDSPPPPPPPPSVCFSVSVRPSVCLSLPACLSVCLSLSLSVSLSLPPWCMSV